MSEESTPALDVEIEVAVMTASRASATARFALFLAQRD
jgi:hypothetical protein